MAWLKDVNKDLINFPALDMAFDAVHKGLNEGVPVIDITKR